MSFFNRLFGNKRSGDSNSGTAQTMPSDKPSSIMKSLGTDNVSILLKQMREMDETSIAGNCYELQDMISSLGSNAVETLGVELAQYIQVGMSAADQILTSTRNDYDVMWSGAAARVIIGALEKICSDSKTMREEIQSSISAALIHPMWEVRKDAAAWLMDNGDKSALPYLRRAIDDESLEDHSWGIARRQAQEAIKEIEKRSS